MFLKQKKGCGYQATLFTGHVSLFMKLIAIRRENSFSAIYLRINGKAKPGGSISIRPDHPGLCSTANMFEGLTAIMDFSREEAIA
jgi:hypothetical protein